MGMGDELMVTGEAAKAQMSDPRKVRIIDRKGTLIWNKLWNNNPRFAKNSEVGDFQIIKNAAGIRPYIEAKTPEKWTWKEYKPIKGEIYFTESEAIYGRKNKPYVVIQPHVKSNSNKQWNYWREFINKANRAGIDLFWLTWDQYSVIRGVTKIFTKDFRTACAVLSHAKAFVGHEGGMHHAAAALDIPSVVIFGGFISPNQTGYDSQVNLYAGGEPCGMRSECFHCKQAMDSISADVVLENLMEILKNES